MTQMLQKPLRSLISRAMPLVARLTRPLTMGVRAMVLDGEGRICLIRHSYVAGWHMPGGAIEPGETAGAALERELWEETGLQAQGTPELFALYLNRRWSARDHVALYLLRQFEATDHRPSPREILEQGFFPLDALPEGTTGPTRRRIAEVLERRPPDPFW
jgi:8-oxo-dGTP pyrophosphatase MutT (NUDIX family)